MNWSTVCIEWHLLHTEYAPNDTVQMLRTEWVYWERCFIPEMRSSFFWVFKKINKTVKIKNSLFLSYEIKIILCKPTAFICLHCYSIFNPFSNLFLLWSSWIICMYYFALMMVIKMTFYLSILPFEQVKRDILFCFSLISFLCRIHFRRLCWSIWQNHLTG